MSYNNIVMYLIVNAEVNKQLVGDRVSVQKITSRKFVEPPAWFQAWSKAFEGRINTRFEQIETRLDKIEARLNNLVRLNNLKE